MYGTLDYLTNRPCDFVRLPVPWIVGWRSGIPQVMGWSLGIRMAHCVRLICASQPSIGSIIFPKGFVMYSGLGKARHVSCW